MEQSTVTELRREVSAIADLSHALTDRLDDLYRRLAAIEDSQAAYQASARRLRSVLSEDAPA